MRRHREDLGEFSHAVEEPNAGAANGSPAFDGDEQHAGGPLQVAVGLISEFLAQLVVCRWPLVPLRRDVGHVLPNDVSRQGSGRRDRHDRDHDTTLSIPNGVQ